MKNWNPFSLSQWLVWLMSTIVAAITGTVGIISWANSNFEGKEQAEIKAAFGRQTLEKIDKRLERIENKIDNYAIKHR